VTPPRIQGHLPARPFLVMAQDMGWHEGNKSPGNSMIRADIERISQPGSLTTMSARRLALIFHRG
jgi:hypothetical protein